MNKDVLASLEKSPPILVTGDIMLDTFVHGLARESRQEAPAPVILKTSQEARLGGCGSVITALSSQGAVISSLCFIGGDADAMTIKKQLLEKCGHVYEVPTSRRTTTRTRIVAAGHHLVRVDDEESSAMTREEQSATMRALEIADFGELKAAVISDHDKGFCSPLVCRTVIERTVAAGIPVFVKPGNGDWEKYTLATVVSPSLDEISVVLGREVENDDSAVERAGREVLERFRIGMLAVTRGRKGLSIIRQGEVRHTGTTAQPEGRFLEASDLLNSVAARLAASGMGIDAALAAAGEAVSISSDIIEAASVVDTGENDGRITGNYTEAGRLAAYLKRNANRVVFTNGCFDVLHPGHLSLLRRARGLGEYLIVGLNSDASVRRLKGPSRPVNDEKTRAVMLSSLRYVDLVVVYEEDTPEELLRAVRPDILVKGSEYRLEDVPGREFAASTVLLSMVPGFSSTTSIKNIKAR